MPSPFPGMDPYLEPYWQGVHTLLISSVWRTISPALPSGLFALVEQRVTVQGDVEDARPVVPDMRVFTAKRQSDAAGLAETAAVVAAPFELDTADEPAVESYIRIVDGRDRLVTVVELVSPANKRNPGLAHFRRNRDDLLTAGVQFVEVDLVRAGRWRSLMAPYRCPPEAVAAYRTTVYTAGEDGRRAFLYPMPLRDPLPPISIPLRPDDAPASLALQPLVDDIYRLGPYDRPIDYAEPPDPPLDADDAMWAAERLVDRV